MEVSAIKEYIYAMITKYLLYGFLNLLFCLSVGAAHFVPCFAATQQPDKTSVPCQLGKSMGPELSDQFNSAMQKNGYTVHLPEKIKKPEVVDNIIRIKTLFNDEDNLFFSYSTLNRYMIYKGNQIRARLYCFRFENNSDALTWFKAVDNSKSAGNRRLVVLRKPKKLIALAENKVFLLEGYHISNFSTLDSIINQLENVEYVIGPTETKKVK
jgi:hypothetical protein